jgi:hypothetical protein
MNVPFGASLTEIATLPPGSDLDRVDPYAEKKSLWPAAIVIFIVIIIAGYCWWQGAFDRVIPPNINSVSIFGTNSPAFQSMTNNAIGWKRLGTNAPLYLQFNPPPPPATNAPAAK